MWTVDHWSQFGLDSLRHQPELAMRWLYTFIQAVIPLAAAAQQAREEVWDEVGGRDNQNEADFEFQESRAEAHAKELADQAIGYMKINRELVEALATERTKAEQARMSAYHWETTAKTAMQMERTSLMKVAKREHQVKSLQNNLKNLAQMYREEKLQSRGLREVIDGMNQRRVLSKKLSPEQRQLVAHVLRVYPNATGMHFEESKAAMEVLQGILEAWDE